MHRRTVRLLTTRANGRVYFRENVLKGLESVETTDNAFKKSSDRPYPIGEIVRRMVRIKRKCINAIGHGDDHEHSLLRGEYKYFTGKAIDVRGAAIADLIAFVQCCSFFKFFDTSAMDRVLEELSLKVTTLQPLEVLALMTALSDLPSKTEGFVDMDALRSQYDAAEAVGAEVRDAATALLGSTSVGPEKKNANDIQNRKKSPYQMSHKELRSFSTTAISSPNSAGSSGGPQLEIMNHKNFTDYRFRGLAVGSVGASSRQLGSTEGSSQAAINEARARAARTHAEHTYHQTLSASFFNELCSQALLFMGSPAVEEAGVGGGGGTPCQFSIEEQLEMLATLPEECDQELVMALLDSLAAPIIHHDHYMRYHNDPLNAENSPEDGPAMTPLVEQGQALVDLYTAMPWHAVTVLKGLLLVQLEPMEVLVAAEEAMLLTFEKISEEELAVGGGTDLLQADGELVVGKGAGRRGGSSKARGGLSKRIEYRQAKAREALDERKQRNEGNAMFIHRATDTIGSIIIATASKPFSATRIEELGSSLGEGEVEGEEDVLLTFSKQCSDAIPASEPRKMAKDFGEEQNRNGGGFAGGQGLGASGTAAQQRLYKRTHMLTGWEIASSAAALSHLISMTGPIVAAASVDGGDQSLIGGLPLHVSKALQQAFVLQLPQADAVSLSLMFSTCRPNSNRYEGVAEEEAAAGLNEEAAAQRKRTFLQAQKQFFSFLRLAEERVMYHCCKLTVGELTDVMGAYLEAYAALGDVHNRLCEELKVAMAGDDAQQLRKEIAAAKARLSASAMVLEELISTALLHVDNAGTGDVDRGTCVSMLTTISLHVFNLANQQPTVVGSSTSGAVVPSSPLLPHLAAPQPMSHQQLWFQRFPHLQRLIHGLGAVVVADAKSYNMSEAITVLQIGVRLGNTMLDAAVTAVLQRVSRLISMEHYEFGGNSAAKRDGGDGAAHQNSIVPLPSLTEIMKKRAQEEEAGRWLAGMCGEGEGLGKLTSRAQREVMRRTRQRERSLSGVADEDAHDLLAEGRGQFAITPQVQERLSYAAAVAARNQAGDLFAVLDDLCTYTERRLEGERRGAVLNDIELVVRSKQSAAAASEFDGLRPRQVEYIQRMLLPALRKASLAE